MALGTVANEHRFQRWFDAGDNAFVNVALALLFGSRFDVEVDELLAFDNSDAQFFSLRRIE